ncbi:FK506-binding nuclear protein-like [Daphnia pulicaria]|uniref:FK506-binding nuclear protein-like n=1 Tax=Daphnia pulicaria TaxID=35523 RepID=UPI001EE9EF9B|nr:FK506-binding nuclear protein-like [Daphnia pulicaria]
MADDAPGLDANDDAPELDAKEEWDCFKCGAKNDRNFKFCQRCFRCETDVDSSESICSDSFFQFDYYGGEDEAEIEVEEEQEIEEQEIEEQEIEEREEVVPVENEEAVAGPSKPKEILKKEAKRRTYKERERMRREEEKKKVTDDVNSLAKTFDEQCSSDEDDSSANLKK